MSDSAPVHADPAEAALASATHACIDELIEQRVPDLAALAERLGVSPSPPPALLDVTIPYATSEGYPGLVDRVLRGYGHSPTLVWMDRPTSYWELLVDKLSTGRPFIIVEHDILPWPGALEQIWDCEHYWCLYGYILRGRVRTHTANGCVKFDLGTKDLVAAVANLPTAQRPWPMLDTTIGELARSQGLEPHVHEPPVIHLSQAHNQAAEMNWAWELVGRAVAKLGW